MSTVAFIGLGAMGSRMAMNLHSAGHALRVFNRNKEKTKQFAVNGIEVCDSPAAADAANETVPEAGPGVPPAVEASDQGATK